MVIESSSQPAAVPFEFARAHGLLPLSSSAPAATDGAQAPAAVRCLAPPALATAAADGLPPASGSTAADNLSLFLDAPLELVPTPEAELRAAIREAYEGQMAARSPLAAATPRTDEGATSVPRPDVAAELAALADRDLLAAGGKAPVARLVDALLFDALSKGASDLHLHPYPPPNARLVVRYRVDGVLRDIYSPDPALHDPLVGRLKVLAGMDVAEKRLPQDGRASVSVGGGGSTSGDGGRQIDLRVSTLPTTCGERVVVRLLEQTARLRTLADLGMPPAVEAAFRAAVGRSHGLVLVTGPTGSGKTTTLYAALGGMDSNRLNVLTLEDPVEYRLQGVSQTQVATKKGMTFAGALRHVLRQDPDVILVGEVRDEPTARMVIQSAMTGHLVLTTLHTNSAAGAVARLADLGVEPYLIASSLVGVLAQRLVRLACIACGGRGGAGGGGMGAGDAGGGARCTVCGGAGYAGRTGLYEWLPVTPEVRERVQASADAAALEALAVRQGMRTLWQEGRELAARGRTTEAELHRVLGAAGPEE